MSIRRHKSNETINLSMR